MAEAVDGKIVISTGMDNSGFIRDARELRSAIESLQAAINSLGGKTSSAVTNIGQGTGRATRQTATGAKSAAKELIKLEQQIAAYKARMAELQGMRIKTDLFTQMEKEAEKAGQNLEKVLNRIEKFEETGGNKNSKQYLGMQYDLAKAETEYDRYQEILDRMQKDGTAYVNGQDTAEYQKLNQELTAAQARYNALMEAATNAAGQSSSAWAVVDRVMSRVSASARKLLSHLVKLGGRMVHKGIDALSDKLSELTSHFHRSSRGSNDFSKTLRKGLRFLMRYVVGVRSFYFLVRKIRAAIKEGFTNLAQYSDSVNQSISGMKNSFATLKNQFAASFAPIANIVLPILTSLIDMLTAATAQIGAFFAALSGQSTYIKAVKVQKDFAASLNNTGSAASGAADAAKEAKRELAGFDKLEILEANDSGSGGRGGGGGGAGSGAGGLFETVEVESPIKDIGEKIREFIKNEDFAGLGTYIADQVNVGLEKLYNVLDWDNNIGPKVVPKIHAITDFLNSFVLGVDWDLLGRDVGSGLNDIIYIVDEFVNGIQWDAWGASLAAGVNGLVDQVDADAVGGLFAGKFNRIWNTVYGFVSDFKWNTLGSKIATGINGYFDRAKLNVKAETLAKFINGAFDTLGSISLNVKWGDIAGKIASSFNKFASEMEWVKNGLVLGDFVKRLCDALVSLVTETDWQTLFAGFAKSLGAAAPDILDGLTGLAIALVKGVGAALDGLWIGFWDGIGKALVEKDINWGDFSRWAQAIVMGLGEALASSTTGQVIASLLGIPGISASASVSSSVTSYAETITRGQQDTGNTGGGGQKMNLMVNMGANLDPSFVKMFVENQDGYFDPKVQDKDVTAEEFGKQNATFNSFFGKNSTWNKLRDKAVKATRKGAEDKKNTIESWFGKKSKWAKLAKNKSAKATAKGSQEKSFTNLYDKWDDLYSKTITLSAVANFGSQVASLVKMFDTGVLTVSGKRNAEGGIITGTGRVLRFAAGGRVIGGRPSWFDSINKYAAGTSRAHGSLFLAGEAGPEVLGHVNGRTEILNRSQLATTMYGAVSAAMSPVAGMLNRLAAIQMHVAYREPRFAAGTVLPYSITGTNGSRGLQDVLDASNEAMAQLIVNAISAQTVSLVDAMKRYQSTGSSPNYADIAQKTIDEINRRTIMFRSSPIAGVN